MMDFDKNSSKMAKKPLKKAPGAEIWQVGHF